jgi:hypothetical protein
MKRNHVYEARKKGTTMWIAGLLVYYLFYRFHIAWYLSLWTKSPLERPYYWGRTWYHVAALAIAILLFALSVFLFSRTNGWLLFVPLVLFPISTFLLKQKRGKKLDEAVRTAVALDHLLLAQRESRSDINRYIAKQLLGSEPSKFWVGDDWDVRSILKFYILPQLGLYDVQSDLASEEKPGSMTMGARIDALIDFWERETRNQSLSVREVAHEHFGDS